MDLDEMSPAMESAAMRVEYGPGHVLGITYEPFSATLFVNGEATVVVNGKNQFHFEYHRTRHGEPALGAISVDTDDDKHQGKKIGAYLSHRESKI